MIYHFLKKIDEEKRLREFEMVENGRLVFVGGGWSSPDEATNHADDILNNFAIGLEFL